MSKEDQSVFTRWEIVSTTVVMGAATIVRSGEDNLFINQIVLHPQFAPLQISFYCGHEPECDEFGSEAALSIAKRNVEKYLALTKLI